MPRTLSRVTQNATCANVVACSPEALIVSLAIVTIAFLLLRHGRTLQVLNLFLILLRLIHLNIHFYTLRWGVAQSLHLPIVMLHLNFLQSFVRDLTIVSTTSAGHNLRWCFGGLRADLAGFTTSFSADRVR